MYRNFPQKRLAQGNLDWPPILTHCHVGTGSGMNLDADEIRRTGQVVTGYELLEVASKLVNHQEFQVNGWLERLKNEVQHRTVIVVERPTLENQFGKFRFDPSHPWNIYGWPPGTDSWQQNVEDGRDPGHGR